MRSRFQWARACVRGASHRACGAPCQDAIATRLVQTSTLPIMIAAVADGAGSADYGGTGAKIAANTFVQTVAGQLKDGADDFLGLAQKTARLVHHVLRDHAANKGHLVREYSTTLLACITNGERTALLQIGDGAIVFGPDWELAFEPQRGEYVNMAFFITDDDALDRVESRLIVGPARTISLMTDGLEPLVVTAKGVHPPLFEHLVNVFGAVKRRGHVMALSRQLQDLLSGPNVQDHVGDDASLVTLHHIAPNTGAANAVALNSTEGATP